MSIYLFDEQPIIANKTLAREIGLNEALILQQINYWIEINKKSGNNYYDRRYWTYNSIRAWQENDFDYMSLDTVKRTFAKLEKAGFLLVGNYNKDPRDKTKWYTINTEKLEELYTKIEDKKQKKELKALEKAMPNALVQNAPMEKCKIHQCISADCTDALEQNPPMQCGNMPQPLPEITTNNSSNITTDISSYNSTHHSITGENEKNKKRTEGEEEKNKDIYEKYLEELRTQVGYYEYLEVGDRFKAKDFDEIVKILSDVMVLDDRQLVTINQTRLPAQIVKERYRKLNSEHLEYLVNVIKENEYKIRNIRAFVLTVAYNAPSGIDAHYSALVSYDMRGGI